MSPLHRLAPAALLALLTACSSNPPSSVALSDDSRCPLDLTIGQTLIVSLPSNPASGFRWVVLDAAPEVLVPLGPEVFTTPDDEALIAGDGISTWRFDATQLGEAHLHLAYQRPWEAEPTPTDAFDCRIRVQ